MHDSISHYFQEMLSQLTPIYGAGEARQISRIVFEDAFAIFHFDESQPFTQVEKHQEILGALLAKKPVQYVLGMADFYGLKFMVDESVLIPRQDTEILVHDAIKTIRDREPGNILDIGAGSGCIPLTLKKHLANWKISSIDVSEEALAVAQKNGEHLGLEVDFSLVDFLDETTWEGFGEIDLLVSNPPYIAEAEKQIMPDNVLQNEPFIALFAPGEDPDLFYQKIAIFAERQLKKDAWIFLELNEFRWKEIQSLFLGTAFKNLSILDDFNDAKRVLKVQRN